MERKVASIRGILPPRGVNVSRTTAKSQRAPRYAVIKRTLILVLC